MGHQRSRAGLQRQLLHEARRIGQHAKHLSVEEETLVANLVDELGSIHTDDEKCQNLCRRYGDQYQPWGTRYAPWWRKAWEQSWRVVFPRK